MTLQEFYTRWTTRREEFLRLTAYVDGAKIIDAVLADCQAVLKEREGQLLSLAAASLLSGYSADHLGLLIRQGKIPNFGKRGAPRIRLGDLPRKPRRLLANAVSTGYDVHADARALRSRRHTGDNNGGQY